MAEQEYQISAPALHAARTILRNFDLAEKTTIRATERNLAIIVDVCTQVFRVEGAVDRLVRQIPWQNKDNLGQSLEQLREAIYALDIVRNSMPNYGPASKAAPRKSVGGVRDHLTRQQVREAGKLAGELASAGTVQEQQRLLRAAGIVK